MQGADSFHHLFLSPPSSTPQHIFQTFQSALRCWLVHWLHQLFGMISLHSLRLQWDKRVGNVVHIMGVTIQLWKPKLTPECFLLVPRKAKDDLSTGSKPFFLGKHHHSEELLSGFFLGTNKGGFIREGSEKGTLEGSCTTSGNLNASDYQRWFTSVHFAPSIVKDAAFICIDSLFHNMSLGIVTTNDDWKAWASRTLNPTGEDYKGFW